MIIGTIKSLVIFCASYVFLSFQFNGSYLFDHLTRITGPVGQNAQEAIAEGIQGLWKNAKNTGAQFFNNSEPALTFEDEVAKKQSAIQKKAKRPATKKAQERPAKKENFQEEYLEELRKEEADSLSRIIENS